MLPTPVLTSEKNRNTCDNSVFNYTATSSADPGRPIHGNAEVAGIDNPAGMQDNSVIDEILRNTTDQPIVK